MRRTPLLLLVLLLNVKVAPAPVPDLAAEPIAFPVPIRTNLPLPKPKPLRVPKPAPAPQAARKRAVAAPAKRWIPTGTGMWTYQWNRTERGDARAVVRRARQFGLTHIYVRTGTRKGGFDGGPILAELMPIAKAGGIKVIAWDFPMLENPRAEARRLATAARFGVAAVAPDIETPAEGTRLSPRAVDIYLKELRRLLPKHVPIFGVVPWPSEHRIKAKFPYGIVAHQVDAIVPMAYWINRDPATVTRQTMRRLKPYRKPVMPVGQAYDPRIDVPSLRWGAPSRRQMDAFLHTARKEGAPSASLWVWQFASVEHWLSVSAFKLGFRGAHAS